MLLAGCSTGGAASPVATDTVDLPPSYRFAPADIQVAAGTTVTWTNHDNFTHSVQLDGDTEPLAVLKPGDSATHTFTEPGTYPYICSFHPQDMTGTVEVTGQ
jgi:plastocyanin